MLYTVKQPEPSLKAVFLVERYFFIFIERESAIYYPRKRRKHKSIQPNLAILVGLTNDPNRFTGDIV